MLILHRWRQWLVAFSLFCESIDFQVVASTIYRQWWWPDVAVGGAWRPASCSLQTHLPAVLQSAETLSAGLQKESGLKYVCSFPWHEHRSCAPKSCIPLIKHCYTVIAQPERGVWIAPLHCIWHFSSPSEALCSVISTSSKGNLRKPRNWELSNSGEL